MSELAQQLRLPSTRASVRVGGEGLPIDRDFDVELANEMARLESFNKHLYRPNTYLHKWWARRCGTTFRVILKHLVEDPQHRDYYSPGGLEGKVILDPMMGGATTLHEALRLGANVMGVDIDPIPVLQARATLSSVPSGRLEAAFQDFYASLRRRVALYFRTTCPQCGDGAEVAFTLHGQIRTCRCGPAVFVDSTTLRHESDGTKVRLCPDCGVVFTSENTKKTHDSCLRDGGTIPVKEKGTRTCEHCGDNYQEILSLPFYARYTPVALAGRCSRDGLFFKKPDDADNSLIAKADENRPGSIWEPLEDFAVEPGPKSVDLVRRKVHSYLDLFSSRQLIYLMNAVELLLDVDGLSRLNLGLLVSTSLEFNSMLCGYKGAGRRRPGAVRHTFSHHAYSFPYTALENNPVHPRKASGTLQNLFHSRIRRARSWAQVPQERRIKGGRVVGLVPLKGELDAGLEVSHPEDLREGMRRFLVIQGSSVSLDLPSNSIDHVVTDPPYFDNVQYSDLAAFFRVWLRRMFAEDLEWDYELTGSAVDPQANGNGQYATVLSGIFAECHRVLRNERGRLIFTFHHWNPKAWAGLTMALLRSGFVLLNSYVIHSENRASVHISNLRSLEHDAVLVLGSATSNSSPEWVAPKVVDTSGSMAFTRDCASALGWMLSSDLQEDEIDAAWDRLIR